MPLIRHMLGMFIVLLFAVFGVVAAIAFPLELEQADHFPIVQHLTDQSANLTFAARVPPQTGENVENTGASSAGAGEVRVFDTIASLGGMSTFSQSSIAPNRVERIVVRTNSAGESVVSIQGREMSIHASQQATTRGISNDSIASAMDQQPFSYVQNGQTLHGYYDASSNTFVGVGDRITTVIRPRNPTNYLNNLRNRQ